MNLSLSLTGNMSLTGASTFSPLALSPSAWYDPSDLATLFQNSNGTGAVTADGDPVGYMADKSGNGNHLVRRTDDANRPLYKTSGGLHWLLFDGTNDGMDTAAFALSQPIDRLSALRIDLFTNGDWFIDAGAPAQMGLRQIDPTPNMDIFAGGAITANSAATLGAAHVFSERFNGASSSLRIDATTTTGNAGSQNQTALNLGGNSGGGFGAFRFYGMILKAGTLDAAQLTSARAYLAAKAGI